MSSLNLQPVSFDEACAFIDDHHSHHDPPQGWKFGTAVNNGEDIVGVCTVGRPVARHFQDGYTLEVTRCCTDGTKNAASKLYAAAWRAARALGYNRLITYTLTEHEDGTSLNAAGGKLSTSPPVVVLGIGPAVHDTRRLQKVRRRSGKSMGPTRRK